MPIFTKIESFTRQIAIFLNGGRYQKAYELANEMAGKFPNEMIAHFLLAKSAFRIENYKICEEEGQKAFALSTQRTDLMACAILISNAQFMRGEYLKGYRILRNFEQDKNEYIERMLLIFASVLGDGKNAKRYAEELMKINSKIATELIWKMLNSKR